MNPIRLFWATVTDERHFGNLYGYRVHNETLYKYTAMRDDIILVKNIEEADACLYIATPEIFDRKPDIPTFLFTMFEGTTIPEKYLENIKKADFIITPSHWVKSLFEPHFPDKTISVVPHGVEDEFSFVQRNPSSKPFRFLWVGAPNPRKGYQELILCWDKLGLASDPDLELYIKTTRVPNWEVRRKRNVVLDSRNLTRKELIEIYHSAHCFVLPTRGEGFALTLAEAMATGLPAIATGWSGVTEFFDEKVGYPLKYKLGLMDITSPIWGNMGKIEAAFPDVIDLAHKLRDVYHNYKEALQKGLRASIRIKTQFTWEKSAEKLVNSIREGLVRN